MHSIGDVARRTGLSLHTLRLYEAEGFFITPIARDSRGNRIYRDEDIEWLDRCATMRELGMPIAEIARYVRLLREGASDEEKIALIRRHRARVVAELDDARDRLDRVDRKLADYAARLDSGLDGAPWEARISRGTQE